MAKPKVDDATHILKAYKYYLAHLTHCCFDKWTAQWILDNWDVDYETVENQR